MIRRNDKSDPYYCDGIKYTSSFYDTKRCLFDDISLFDNYVIPIKQSMEKGYCKELMSLFAISNTTSIAINKILNPYTNILPDPSTYNAYETSEFGIIENWLKYYTIIFINNTESYQNISNDIILAPGETKKFHDLSKKYTFQLPNGVVAYVYGRKKKEV